jgi:ribosomal-protein-alanine N-acetyltransferase
VLNIEKESGGGWGSLMFESELKNSFSLFLTAENSSGIAGFAIAWIIEGDAQLNKICVRPQLRRWGIGSALISAVITRLNPNIVQLEAAEHNIPAISLYSSFGFVKTGYRKNYYPDDNAVLMELDLTDENRNR